jgi:transposase
MSPENHLVNRFILPDLKLIKFDKISNKTFKLHCIKKTRWEICRKCPTKSFTVHDKRVVTIRDAKLFNKSIKLVITKRRFRCPKCKSVFTENIDGIKQGFRTTEKYRGEILFNFQNYKSATGVAHVLRCSTTLVTKTVNKRLELELRKSRNTPWSSTVLIDEHAFGRNKKHKRKDFVTCFVDNNRKILREMAPSRNYDDMKKSIEHVPGKEKVDYVVMDMSPIFRSFTLDYFPNAKIVVDKFHVIRLIHPAIRKYRKEATGDKRSNPIRHLLLKNRSRLQTYQKRAVTRFCKENPNVNEVYRFKERITNFYNIKGFRQASLIFTKITDDMANSKIKEIQKLRRTLMKWREEILRYFKTGLTNARIEGINRKCKLLQRCAYGFQNFDNYRLRALYSCS